MHFPMRLHYEDPENLRLLKRKIDTDLILILNVLTIKGKVALSYKLVSAKDGSLQKQAKILFGELPTKKAERGRGTGPQTSFDNEKRFFEFINKEQFPYELVDFDVGDVTGDGVKEYILIAVSYTHLTLTTKA